MFKNPKGSKPVATNTRAVEVANQTIDHLGATMQRTLANAITGDGRECLLYIPKVNGLRCTCQNTDPLDLNGKMRPEVMTKLLTDSDWVAEEDYPKYNENDTLDKQLGTDDDWGFSVDEDHATNAKPTISKGDSAKESKGYSTKVFSLSQLDDDTFDPDDMGIELPDFIDTLPNQDQNLFIYNNGPISTTSCPICLGAGWVGGYDLYGGTRLTLPASAASIFKGAVLQDGNPDFVVMPKGSSIIFSDLIFPRGVDRLDECAMWSTRDKVPFHLNVEGQQVLIPRLVESFDGRSHSVEFVAVMDCEVTHATLQYGTAKLLIDVSPVTLSNNNTVFDQQSDVSLVLPAITQRELKGAIVFDSTDGKFYRVTTMNTSHTKKGWVQNLNLEARIVQPYELVTLLPALGKQSRKFNGRFAHTAILPKHF